MYLCIYVSMYLYTYVHERHCRGVSFFRVSGPSRCRGRTTHLSTSRCTPNHIWSQCWCSKPPGPGSTWVTVQYFCNGAALLTEKSSVQQRFIGCSTEKSSVHTCHGPNMLYDLYGHYMPWYMGAMVIQSESEKRNSNGLMTMTIHPNKTSCQPTKPTSFWRRF